MSKRLWFITLTCLLLVIFILWKIIAHFEKPAARGMPPATVEVAAAVQQNWKDQILATGTISALNGVIIKPEVSGRITKIYFNSGQYVKAGDPLFQIYPDILEAQLASNEAALALAQVEYDRASELFQKNVTSKQTLDEQTAKLKSAQAMVMQTKAELAEHNIVAPFDGKIGLKKVDIGDYVNVGDSLVPLQQMDPLRVQFSVADRFINIIKENDPVAIEVSSAPDVIYQGYVYALNAGVNPTTRMFSLWAKIPNPDNSLLPGTYVQITLFSGQAKPVIAVPQTAVLYSPQGEYVYKIVDKTAKKVQVSTGLRKDNLVAINGDIKPGDVIVTSGQVKLFDNTPVNIAKQSTYAQTIAPKIKIIRFPDAASQAPAQTQAQPQAQAETQLPAQPQSPSPAAPETKPQTQVQNNNQPQESR